MAVALAFTVPPAMFKIELPTVLPTIIWLVAVVPEVTVAPVFTVIVPVLLMVTEAGLPLA